MGARAQVKIEDTGVFLYTHWGSKQIVQDVRTVIKWGKRLDDPEYLARIVFDQMTLGQQGSETGAGIGTSQHGDIEILVTLDCQSRLVHVQDLRAGSHSTMSFSEFASE